MFVLDSFVAATDGSAVRLDPALNARLWAPSKPHRNNLRTVSIAATVRLESNASGPIVAHYTSTVSNRRLQPAWGLDLLSRGRVRFTWLPRGARTAMSCTTDFNTLNPRAENEIVASRDHTTGKVRIWVNGFQKKVCADTPRALATADRQLFVGSWTPGSLPAGTTPMRLNDLRIYRKVLNGRDVRSFGR